MGNYWPTKYAIGVPCYRD